MTLSRNFFRLAVPVLLLTLYGCGGEKEKCAVAPDTSGIEVSINLESLEDKLVKVESREQLKEILQANPILRDHFLGRENYPNDSIFLSELYRRMSNPHMDTLAMEIDRVFGDRSALRTEFEQAFTNMQYYYPDIIVPRVQTVLTGFENDLYVSDTLIIVGLDYYLGEGARYRPRDMYDYILRRYSKEYIVPSCMLLYGIDPRINKTDLADKTVLGDMISYGKSFYFAKHMQPCIPDSVLIWYTREEIEGARKNQDLIWFRLVEDQVLYSTNHMVKRKYIEERPKTHEVGEKCPGRIAQWVGWEIVKKYMETHPEVSLQQMMQMRDADKIFKESKYKPKG